MSKARRGDKSFQHSSAGKGDADRTSDRDAYSRGYDAIDWGRPTLPVPECPAAITREYYESLGFPSK